MVYPTPVSKLFPGRVDAGPGFTLDMTLDELERQGMSKAFTVEHAYFKDRGLESEFQVPKGTDVQLKDIAPHWLSGFVTNELNDVVQETNCPALKRDLVALRGIPPVK